jgi:hypothetical protein
MTSRERIMAVHEPIYGVLAGFDNLEALIHATRAARADGYTALDAYSPLPSEELVEALGVRPTRLPVLVLIGGLVGAVGGFFMQYYASAISYPLNVGGRPLNSWPSFVPVTFELTVLCAALTAVLGMLALNGLPRPHHPLFGMPSFDRASRDRFFLCLEAKDPRFDLETARAFLARFNPETLEEVPL